MTLKKISSLEIEKEANDINPNLILARRIAVSFLILILIGAFFGFSGENGFLEKKIVTHDTQSFIFEYNRFLRKQATSEFKIKLPVTHLKNQKVILWFTQNYLNNFHIKQILPAPLSIKVIEEKIAYEFSKNPNDALSISFLIEPQKAGFVDEQVGLGNHIISFKQFILP